MNYTSLEIIAALTGILNIYLVAKRSLWNFLFGIVTVSIFFSIFFHAKLYADMALQVVYLVLQFYGLYQWLYGGDHHTGLKVIKVGKDQLSYALIVTIALALLLGKLLRYTDSSSVVLDATTTAMSLVAQWMMSKKWLQHWWLWMVMNILSIFMYSFKGLFITAILYAVYLGICLLGYYQWHAEWHSARLKSCTA